MKTLSVADFKSSFSAVLEEVRAGKTIAITYGKKKEIQALITPPKPKQAKRRLGILEGKASFKFIGSHNTTEEEFFGV